MIKLNINVTKIPKERIFEGKNGKYLSLVLHDNKEGPDQYGNDGFIAIDVTKEEREAGVRGPIVGNWKHVGTKRVESAPKKPASAPRPPADPDLDVSDDDIPF